MSKRKRDHKAEYRRRVARALKQGLTRSQARGHPRAAEVKKSKAKGRKALEDSKLQTGLRLFLKKKNFNKAAKEAHISVERLRAFAVEQGVAEKRGNRWVIKQQPARRLLIYSDGREHIVLVSRRTASLVGRYMAGVRWFVQTNDIAHIAPFVGKSITDLAGKHYALETKPNSLHRLAQTGASSFEQIYRIVI